MAVLVKTQEQTPQGGKRKLRSETLSVRLDPKLRYLAELAGRKQRRTVSSFVEWAIEDALGRVYLREPTDYDHHGTSVRDVAEMLWDVFAAERFVKLALSYPELLTHHEQLVWKLIRENGFLWKGAYDERTGIWTWQVAESSIIYERLRQYWGLFNTVAGGDAPMNSLPTWNKERPKPDAKIDIIDVDPEDEDIPF